MVSFMKNNKILFGTVKAVAAIGSLFLFAGQASAHVGYGHALYDDSPLVDPADPGKGTVAETRYMHLAASNLGKLPTQPDGTIVTSLTATSNAGYVLARNKNTWGNTHDNRFMWFYISKPTRVHFTITGLANPNYVTDSTKTASTLCPAPDGCPIDTLNPGYVLFQGKAPPSAHDGAYGAFNTGFAAWSAWAQQAAPAGVDTVPGAGKFHGVGNTSAEGNPIQGLSYTTDASSLNVPGTTIDGTAAGVTAHMGVYGNYEAGGTGPLGEAGFYLANNASQLTFPDGSPSTDHWAFLEYAGFKKASPVGNALDSGCISLKRPGVYSLVIGGANPADAAQLLKDAKLTGMGPEGCTVDANGNCDNGSSATANDWDRYKNVDRKGRNFKIEFGAC